MWFRRDLRLTDNPALDAAVAAAKSQPEGVGGGVMAVFISDPALVNSSGVNRLRYLSACIRSLQDEGLPLVVLRGDPVQVLPALAKRIGAAQVFCSADFGPYGRRRDQDVERALAVDGVELHSVGSPYVLDPGTVRKGDGTPFKVFTPFSRVWGQSANSHMPGPRMDPASVAWLTAVADEGLPGHAGGEATGATLPEAGERAAAGRIRTFVDNYLRAYDELRNNPAADATSRLSPDLKYGVIHPRQLLTLLGQHPGEGARVFRTELCWRDFYADVLWHRPDTARSAFNTQMQAMHYDSGPDADERFRAWCTGTTGYPFIDAGMRQLQAEGWMHNRVRMAVASFLVKDLHVDWRRGARWFMEQLVDGDLASNQHGWQWTAGTGTDAAPYFRVFNPVSQGKKFDPDGAYVKRYVPELAGVTTKYIHEPWLDPAADDSTTLFAAASGPAQYASRIVDHAEERIEALARYGALRSEPRP